MEKLGDVGQNRSKLPAGFTIVELLIVVIVIAILAAITIVAYTGIANRAKASAAQSGAGQGYKKIVSYAIMNGDQYPTDLAAAGLPTSGSTYYEYTVNNAADPATFCLTATVSKTSYYVSSTNSSPTGGGTCPGHTGIPIVDGSPIQTITSANCPSNRLRTVDARDNHTYWVKKLADGKCWMLTNLGYTGGGTNTYSDTKTLTNGTGGSTTYTTASYYVVPLTTNYTTEPSAPSTSTDGGATSSQYGYLYNWCAAMGGQATAACANASTPTPNASISVCPAGWRLPTGAGGELGALNTAVNGGSTDFDTGLLSNWLGQRSGNWNSGFTVGVGYYWSSTPGSANAAYSMYFSSSFVSPGNISKYSGVAVRCIAI